MSFLSSLENGFKSLIGQILTPQTTTVIAGQIVAANITMPTASGAEKQSAVASAVSEIFQIGEGLALGLVKTVFALLEAKTPTALVPVVAVAETTAEQVVQAGAQNLANVATSKLTAAPTPPASTPSAPAPQLIQSPLGAAASAPAAAPLSVVQTLTSSPAPSSASGGGSASGGMSLAPQSGGS